MADRELAAVACPARDLGVHLWVGVGDEERLDCAGRQNDRVASFADLDVDRVQALVHVGESGQQGSGDALEHRARLRDVLEPVAVRDLRHQRHVDRAAPTLSAAGNGRMFRYMFLSLTASAASTQVLIAHVETTGTECAHVMVRPLTPQTVSILSRRAAQDRPGQPVVGRRQHIGRQRGHPRELPCSMRSVRTSYSGPVPPFSGPGRQQSKRPGLA